jgi:hypothetical protein
MSSVAELVYVTVERLDGILNFKGAIHDPHDSHHVAFLSPGRLRRSMIGLKGKGCHNADVHCLVQVLQSNLVY